jgi:hypothetical protein
MGRLGEINGRLILAAPPRPARVQSRSQGIYSNSHFKTFVLFSGIYKPFRYTVFDDRILLSSILILENLRTISIMRIAGEFNAIWTE